MQVKWQGIYPAVTTKFHPDESLDIPTFQDNLKAQIDAGVDGIVVCGTLGENNVLNPQEKLQLIEAAKEIAGRSIPVIIGIAENSTSAAMAFARGAQKAGADGSMLLPPMRYHSDVRETLRYLHRVAEAADMPVMLYNNPISYKILITPAMFEDLARNPQFQAVKESCGDIRYMTELRIRFGDRFRILSGVDDLALESLLMGADGWVAGLVCAFPRETVAIYRLVQAGRYEEARAIYHWFIPLLRLDVHAKLVQNIKLAEQITGLGTETVREPRLPLEGQEREEVHSIIHKAIESRPKLDESLFANTKAMQS